MAWRLLEKKHTTAAGGKKIGIVKKNQNGENDVKLINRKPIHVVFNKVIHYLQCYTPTASHAISLTPIIFFCNGNIKQTIKRQINSFFGNRSSLWTVFH